MQCHLKRYVKNAEYEFKYFRRGSNFRDYFAFVKIYDVKANIKTALQRPVMVELSIDN